MRWALMFQSRAVHSTRPQSVLGELEGVVQKCHAGASIAKGFFDESVFEVERGARKVE